MKILISGGTGLIGSAVCSRLLQDNHSVVVLSRTPNSLGGNLRGISAITQLNEQENIDVILNLAGEPIANQRWSKQQKQRILDSRLITTEKLLTYIANSQQKPKVFISGSAIGYYGIGVSDVAVNEQSECDSSFSSTLCQQWENAALRAEQFGVRTCLLRTGIVLAKQGGALKKMRLPFSLGLGGPMGKGNQWMPWIHLQDLVNIILYCIEHAEIRGPVNATAPNPVTNKVFAKALGRALKRPAILPVPSFVVKMLLGQMGEELLLSGKRVLPEKLLKAGYQFEFETIDAALANLGGKRIYRQNQ